DSKTLLFIGCMSSYRVKEQAISAAKILNQLGIKFDYLGEQELCCSGFLKRIGFIDEFKVNKQKLEEKLKKYNQIITICPGCYSAFREFYADFFEKNNIEIKHLVELLDLKKLKVEKQELKTTYHDPCHIGRQYNLFDPPRKILAEISSYKEMLLSKENSICCGAGGGCLSAFPELSEKIAASRVEDASNLDCDFLVTTCPFCEYNLKKGLKNNTKKLKVISIQKLLNEILI
ncbi:MAG: (Fe-S)-binding protein, partial [Candidatus Hodarchaeota archaeon]